MGAAGMRIEAELRRDIVTGALTPGTRLTEASLTARYGSSRVPVREALRSLAADGLVTVRSNAGARVADLPAEDLDDLYAVRTTIEGITVRRCADRVAAGHPQVVTDLQAITAAGWAALRAERTAEVAEANTAFHLAIARHSGAATMGILLSRLAERIQWAYSATVPRQGTRSWTEHDRIVAAVAAGDGGRAEQLMAEHITASQRGYRQRSRP